MDGVNLNPSLSGIYQPTTVPTPTERPNVPVGDKVSPTPEKASPRETELKEKEIKRLGFKECQTCKNRKYVDGSNDPGVSFKTPTHVSPSVAAAAVSAHEGEHVTHEQARAAAEGREVVAQAVVLHTAVCPECGRIYVSGGTTTTMTRDKSHSQKPDPRGHNVDLTT